VNPFQEKPLIEQGFFRRLFGKPVPENAYIALENLLARNNWNELHEGHVTDILRCHGLKRVDHTRALDIYKTAFSNFIEDEAVTDSEAQSLARLRDLLGIRNSDADEIEKQIVHPFYEKTVGDVLADEAISPEERDRLDRLRTALRLDEEKAAGIYAARAKEIMQSRFSEMVSDKRVSDAEIATFEKRAGALGARMELDYSARELMERFRTFWRSRTALFRKCTRQ
jgi:Chloroplast envelope transporter